MLLYQIYDCDTVKYRSVRGHIMPFNTDKTIMSTLKISTYIITNITARPIRRSAILVKMSVSTFKADFIQL